MQTRTEKIVWTLLAALSISCFAFAVSGCGATIPKDVSGEYEKVMESSPPEAEIAPDAMTIAQSEGGAVFGDGRVGMYFAGDDDALTGIIAMTSGEDLFAGAVWYSNGLAHIRGGFGLQGDADPENRFHYVEYVGALGVEPAEDHKTSFLARILRKVKNLF